MKNSHKQHGPIPETKNLCLLISDRYIPDAIMELTSCVLSTHPVPEIYTNYHAAGS